MLSHFYGVSFLGLALGLSDIDLKGNKHNLNSKHAIKNRKIGLFQFWTSVDWIMMLYKWRLFPVSDKNKIIV